MGNFPSLSPRVGDLSAELSAFTFPEVVRCASRLASCVVPPGLDSRCTMDAYAEAFTDSHSVDTDGIFVEAPLSLHRALSTPWDPATPTLASVGAIIVAHTLWAHPATSDEVAERYATVLSWFCGASVGALPATAASPAVTLAAATAVVNVVASVCVSVGLGARLPGRYEAEEVARDALAAVGSSATPSVRAFAKWAATESGAHALVTRWTLTPHAFKEKVAANQLPALTAIDSAEAVADRAAWLLAATPRPGVWSVTSHVPGVRTSLAVSVAKSSLRGAVSHAGPTPKLAALVASSAALCTKLATASGLTVAQVTSLRNSFRSEADADGQLGRESFVHVLCATLPAVDASDAERLFSAFDVDDNHKVSFSEFIVGFGKVARGAVAEKIALLWPALDGHVEGGASVSASDLKEGLERGAIEAKLRETAARASLSTHFTPPPTAPRAFLQIGLASSGKVVAPTRPPLATAIFCAAINNTDDGVLEFLEHLCARPAAGVLARALADVAPFLLSVRGVKWTGAAALSGDAGSDRRSVVRDAFARTPVCAVNVAGASTFVSASRRGGAPERIVSREGIAAALFFSFWNESSVLTAPRIQESTDFRKALDDFFVALLFAAEDFGVALAPMPTVIPLPGILFSLSLVLARGTKDVTKALGAFLDDGSDGKVTADAANAWVARVAFRETAALSAGSRFLESLRSDGSDVKGDDNAHAALRAVLAVEPRLVNAFALAFAAPSARATARRPPPISIGRTPSLTSARSPTLTSAKSPTLTSTNLSPSPAFSLQSMNIIPALALPPPAVEQPMPSHPMTAAGTPASPPFYSFGSPPPSSIANDSQLLSFLQPPPSPQLPRPRIVASHFAPASVTKRQPAKGGAEASAGAAVSAAALSARRVDLIKTLTKLESSTAAGARSAKRAEEEGRGAVFDAAAALEAVSRSVRAAAEARRVEALENARKRPSSAAGAYAKPSHATRGSALAAVRAAQAAIGINEVGGLRAMPAEAGAAISIRNAGLFARPQTAAHGLIETATPRPPRPTSAATFKLI